MEHFAVSFTLFVRLLILFLLWGGTFFSWWTYRGLVKSVPTRHSDSWLDSLAIARKKFIGAKKACVVVTVVILTDLGLLYAGGFFN